MREIKIFLKKKKNLSEIFCEFKDFFTKKIVFNCLFDCPRKPHFLLLRYYLPFHPAWSIRPYWSLKILVYPWYSGISVFCDASCFTWISSAKAESSTSNTFPISMSVCNSCLSLVPALKDCFISDGVLSMPSIF